MVSKETKLLNNFNKTQNKLQELELRASRESATYKPIEWFQMEHECEDPGLISNITPDETSAREWDLWETNMCILEARKKCIEIYNETKIMPYFSIYKTNTRKFKWAIFKISDTEFNNKANKNGNYSQIEVQQDNLVMNINFDKQQNINLELSKHNIDIPKYYNIHDVNFNCIESVRSEVSDCDKIKQSKINACKLDKSRAVAENEKKIERGLLADANKLMNYEGFNSKKKNYTQTSNVANAYINEGGSKNDVDTAFNKYDDVNNTLTNILNIRFKHFPNEKKDLVAKQERITKGEKQAIQSQTNNLQNNLNRIKGLAKINAKKAANYKGAANRSTYYLIQAQKNAKKLFTKKKYMMEISEKKKKHGSNWRITKKYPITEYKKEYSDKKCSRSRSRWFKKRCTDYRYRTITSDTLDHTKTNLNKRMWEGKIPGYSKSKDKFNQLALKHLNAKQLYDNIEPSVAAKLNRSKYISGQLEGFDNNVRTCNNNSVNAKFKIHYASDDCK